MHKKPVTQIRPPSRNLPGRIPALLPPGGESTLFLAMVAKDKAIKSIAVIDNGGSVLLNKTMVNPKKGDKRTKLVDIFSVWYELAPLIRGKQVFFENAKYDTFLICQAMAKGITAPRFAELKSGCQVACLKSHCQDNNLVAPRLKGNALERARRLQLLCKPFI